MDPERWRRVQRVFEGALERKPKARLAYLDTETRDDAALRAEVERLLALDASLDEASDQSLAVLPPRMPEEIGPYRVLDVIGEGGVGTVYLAEERGPAPRRVALKLIRLGMESRGVLARFALERQALARMDHPSIAQILDAGETANGRPYFVMEYVEGKPVTAYCDARRADLDVRLRLFAAACRAVDHAHQRGILHRDIKPSNVLVREGAGGAIPVVIDFGLAKAIEAPEGTALTLAGQLVGTPPYMSPEQIEGGGERLDTRTDVYSLGVLLYELVVGVPPFERSADEGLAGFLNRVCDDPPPRPARRLAALDAQENVARARATTVAELQEKLRGDLERIVTKALAKERDERYATAAEFAGEGERLLRGEPLLAGPPSAALRLQSFVRQHRWGVGVFLTLLVAWFSASVGSTAWYLLANERRADKAAIVGTCNAVQLRVADAHLWFEEALARDASVHVDRDVLEPIRESIQQIEAMAADGVAAEREDARAALASLQSELERFETITRERWSKRDQGGETGAKLDQVYDAAYRRILDHSFALSGIMEATMAADWRRSMRLAIAVNLVAMALFAVPAAVVLRPAGRRASRR